MIASGNWGTCEWTLSDEGNLIIGEGQAESVSADGKSPWNEYSDKIRTVSFDGKVDGVVSMIGTFMNCSALEEVDLTGLDTSNTVDMSWLFCGCSRLKHIDLSMLDTSKVVDMSCMFLSCSQLEEIELGSIDTSSVMDMSRMFMYCGSLRTLDFSALDNSSLQMADDMFFGCEGLRAVVPGPNFSMGSQDRVQIGLPETGKDATDDLISALRSKLLEKTEEPKPEAAEPEETEAEEAGEESSSDMVSDWRTSKEGILYIAGTEFSLRYDGNGGKMSEDVNEDEIAITDIAGTQLRARRDLFEEPEGFQFKEWNTHRDGSGTSLQPGQLFHLNSDMILYAIWAGSPVFTEVYPIPEITYGQLLDLPQPRVDARFGDDLKLQVQISNPCDSGWVDFDNEEPLPVSRDGARIRYIASNHVGQTISEERAIHINKDVYNTEEMHWVLPEDLVYNGQEKEVHLEGLPEGVTAEYAGNTAVDMGQYTATAILYWDEDNYQPPDPVPPLQWSITKGRYKMSDLGWNYLEAFTYDGQPKQVRLEGLPEGTTPYYSGADAVDAGIYVATAGLDYDIDNYDSPDPVRPCTWQILKTTHDMSDVKWEGPREFIYDGTAKKVELCGLPEGVHAEYTGNMAIDAGSYVARAAFVLDDPVNYEIPDPVEFSWEIQKADHNMDQATWTDDQLVYNGQAQTISMTGVPEGVSVLYEGDQAVEAGEYTVRAEFCVEDLNNYNQMDPITKTWQIRKAKIDLTQTRWNYSSPYIYNGAEKSVALKNLPAEITEVFYTGERACAAGSYVAHADFDYDKDNYDPPVMPDCRWTILKANLKLQNLAWDYDEPFTYDGQAHGVKITNLPENAQVVYEDGEATGAGTHVSRAVITPKDPDNYNTPQPVDFKWEIRKAVFDIAGARWNAQDNGVFNGAGHSVLLTDLPAGVTASYAGNEADQAGAYRARAVFKVEDTDNFLPPDPMEMEWTVQPSSIDLKGIYWDYVRPYVYDGSEKELLLAGLPEGVVAEYTGNVASEAGEYKAEAVLTMPEDGNYKSTPIQGKVWRIDKADIDVSEAHWNCPDDFVYDGMLKQVFLEGLPDSVRVAYTDNEAADAGEYRAEAVLTPYDGDNFKAPSISGCSWKIGKADIDVSDARWSGYETFVYDGTEHRVILKDLPDTVEAVYEGNASVNAGNFIAFADFRPKDERNYNAPGRLQYEWSVAKAPVKTDSVYWIPETELVYTGQEHTVRLAGLPQGVKASCQGNVGIDAGQYIASAVLEPEDQTNYLPCALQPYRWEIDKAEIDVSDVMWASSGELVYDGTMKVVGLTGLPDDISVEYENNVATDAGTYHASAVLSTHSRNYVAPEIEGCTWTIAKAVPDISGIRWSYAFEFIYDGYEKSVELMDLPDGMTAQYTGNCAIEAGDYVAEARLIMEDSMNYEAPQIAPLSWTIGKRDYDMTTAVWTGAEGFVYDGTLKYIELTGLEEGLEPIYTDNGAVDAGVYTASARFLYDEDNYNPPEDLTCTWEIRKAPLDTSGVAWDYEGPFRAGRKPHTVTLLGDSAGGGLFGRKKGSGGQVSIPGLPEGTTVHYEGNTAREPGVYEAKAYLTIPPQPNHEITEPICLTWEIIDE